jgi:hypothetical protein
MTNDSNQESVEKMKRSERLLLKSLRLRWWRWLSDDDVTQGDLPHHLLLLLLLLDPVVVLSLLLLLWMTMAMAVETLFDESVSLLEGQIKERVP